MNSTTSCLRTATHNFTMDPRTVWPISILLFHLCSRWGDLCGSSALPNRALLRHRIYPLSVHSNTTVCLFVVFRPIRIGRNHCRRKCWIVGWNTVIGNVSRADRRTLPSNESEQGVCGKRFHWLFEQTLSGQKRSRLRASRTRLKDTMQTVKCPITFHDQPRTLCKGYFLFNQYQCHRLVCGVASYIQIFSYLHVIQSHCCTAFSVD